MPVFIALKERYLLPGGIIVAPVGIRVLDVYVADGVVIASFSVRVLAGLQDGISDVKVFGAAHN